MSISLLANADGTSTIQTNGVSAITITSGGIVSLPLTATLSITNLTVSGTTTLTGTISANDISSPSLVGMVSMFARSTAPTGWLSADGAAVSRTTYAALFAAIGTLYGSGNGTTTFNLPDLRGTFLRALDSGKGIDSGRVLGSVQLADTEAHSHSIRMGGDANGVIPVNINNAVTTSNSAVGSGAIGILQISTEGGTETRPINIALLACIKF